MVALLDASNVLYEGQAAFLSKRKSALIIGALLTFDLLTFVWSRLYAFENTDLLLGNDWEGCMAKLTLFIQYVAHARSTVFFRLLAYGRWATWRALKRMKISQKSSMNSRNNRKAIRHLVHLNEQLNYLLSLPLLVHLISFSVRATWALIFYEPFSFRQGVFFLLLGVNVLPVDAASRKIAEELRAKSFQSIRNNSWKKKKKSLLAQEKEAVSRLIYWRQLAAIYQHVFSFRIFSLSKVDRQFCGHLILFIFNYALLINQTT